MYSFQAQLTWHCTHPHFNWRHHTLQESSSVVCYEWNLFIYSWRFFRMMTVQNTILFYSILLSCCTVSDSSIDINLHIFWNKRSSRVTDCDIAIKLSAGGANSYANLCYTRNDEMLIKNNKLSLRQLRTLFVVSLQNWDFLYFLPHCAQMCSNFENIFKKVFK